MSEEKDELIKLLRDANAELREDNQRLRDENFRLQAGKERAERMLGDVPVAVLIQSGIEWVLGRF